MISIFKTQMFRLKKSKAFWIMFGLCGGLPILGGLFLLILEAAFKAIGEGSFLDMLGQTANALTMMSSFASYGTDSALLAIICSAIVLSKEFVNGTMRNVILANKSRTEMFFAYFLTSLVISLSYFGVEYIMYIAVFGPMLGFSGVSAGGVVTALLCFLAIGLSAVLFEQTCVCLFLFCTRKQSLTIVFPLLICLLVPGIVQTIVGVIVVAITVAGKVVSETAGNYIPFMSSSGINPLSPAGIPMLMTIVYNLLFAAMFFVIGFFRFQKADLK